MLGEILGQKSANCRVQKEGKKRDKKGGDFPEGLLAFLRLADAKNSSE